MTDPVLAAPGTGPGAPASYRGRPGLVVAVAIVAIVVGVAIALAPLDLRPLLVLVGVVGAIVCLVRVEIAAALLAASIAGNLASVAVAQGLPSPSLALGALIVVGVAVRRDRWSFLPPPEALLPLGAYVTVVLASALWATLPERSLEVAGILGRDVALGVLVAAVVRRTRTLRLTLWAMVAAVGVLALVSTVQYLTGTFERTFGGLGGAVVANIVAGVDDWRMVGPFGDPNYYGQTLAVAVPIALNRMLYERRPVLRLAALGAAGLCLFAIMTTFSRGAALALVLVVGAMVVARRPKPVPVVAVVLAVGLVVAALPQEYRDRLSAAGEVAGAGGAAAAGDPAVRGRASEAIAGAMMLRDHPLGGVGAGNYSWHYQEYAQPLQLDLRRGERSAHSLYVEIGAETGLVGLVVFGALLVAAFRRLRADPRWSRTAGVGPERGLNEALGLALLAFLATSIVLHAAHARIFWLLAAIALALPAVSTTTAVDAGSNGRVSAPAARRPDGPAPTG